MTKAQADSFMNARFDEFASRAQNAKSDEELIQFTDEAHKIYLTLEANDAFEKESNTEILGS